MTTNAYRSHRARQAVGPDARAGDICARLALESASSGVPRDSGTPGAGGVCRTARRELQAQAERRNCAAPDGPVEDPRAGAPRYAQGCQRPVTDTWRPPACGARSAPASIRCEDERNTFACRPARFRVSRGTHDWTGRGATRGRACDLASTGLPERPASRGGLARPWGVRSEEVPGWDRPSGRSVVKNAKVCGGFQGDTGAPAWPRR